MPRPADVPRARQDPEDSDEAAGSEDSPVWAGAARAPAERGDAEGGSGEGDEEGGRVRYHLRPRSARKAPPEAAALATAPDARKVG
jgi:hypothetical protein